MSNPSGILFSLPAASTSGVCAAQAVAAAGALTLNGALVASGVAQLVTAQRVQVQDSGNSDAAVVFTIKGTNASGATISSTVTGVTSTNSVYTALDFLTVTGVSAGAACVGNINVGTCGVGSTPWIMDNFFAAFWALSIAVTIQSGSVTYTIEHTYDDPNAALSPGGAGPPQAAANFAIMVPSNVPPVAWPNGTLFNVSKNGEAQYVNQPIMAHRLTILSGTGTALMQSIQAGIGSSP